MTSASWENGRARGGGSWMDGIGYELGPNEDMTEDTDGTETPASVEEQYVIVPLPSSTARN